MSEWISVNDRLPKENECVDGWGEINAGYNQSDVSRVENIFYDHKKDEWWTWDDLGVTRIFLNYLNITHWMTLPEPPKPTQEDVSDE